MRGRALPYYGKLQTKTLPREAYEIWLTRNDELPDCEPFGMSCFLQTDPIEDVRRDYVRRLLEIPNFNEDEVFVLRCRFVENMTLAETASELRGVCQERIRQIEARALRKLRSAHHKLSGHYWSWREKWAD